MSRFAGGQRLLDQSVRPTLVRNSLALVACAACSAPTDPPRAALARQASPLTSVERVGPTEGEELEVSRGERVGFTAHARDTEGDLWAAEWYLDGTFLGAQYRKGLPSGTGSEAMFWRGINFPALGEHLLEIQAFDRAGSYSAPVRWRVHVNERPRVLYVDHTDARIATPEGRAALAAFVAEHHVNQVALYRLHVILGQAEPTAALEAQLAALRAAGVQKVFAVVGSVPDVARVRDYLDGPRADSARFDGLLTEYEFWREGQTFRGYLGLLAHARVLADDENLTLATYVGWFDAGQAGAIAGLADIVFLHAYVQRPELAYAYLDNRLRLLAAQGSHEPTLVYPIFSAEVSETGGTAQFMGTWLEDERAPNPLEAAEGTVLRAFRDDPSDHRNGVRLGGFAWFSAQHLEAALE